MSKPDSKKSTSKALQPIVADNALMGAQLTAQYKLALAGAVEVLKFGAMMLMLRDRVATLASETHKGKGRYAKGSGVKGWLKEHAPEVKEGTAYRFLHVAEAIEAKFPLPKGISFVQLATTPAAQLPPKLRSKQKELFEYVSGTSRNSWLDQFKPALPAGGHHPAEKEPTDEEKYQAALAQAKKDHAETFTVLGSLTGRDAYQILTDPELDLAIDVAKAFLAKAEAWRTTPKGKRTVTAKLQLEDKAPEDK